MRLTRTNRCVVSFPLAVLKTFSPEEPVFLTAKANRISFFTVVRYLGQVFAHVKVTFEGYYR